MLVFMVENNKDKKGLVRYLRTNASFIFSMHDMTAVLKLSTLITKKLDGLRESLVRSQSNLQHDNSNCIHKGPYDFTDQTLSSLLLDQFSEQEQPEYFKPQNVTSECVDDRSSPPEPFDKTVSGPSTSVGAFAGGGIRYRKSWRPPWSKINESS